MTEPVLYLDGRYLPASEATISVDDRGFLFADGCYEVTLLVDGSPIALDRHLARLQRGLDEIRIGCARHTIDYAMIRTSEPLDAALASYFSNRLGMHHRN